MLLGNNWSFFIRDMLYELTMWMNERYDVVGMCFSLNRCDEPLAH